jgi:V8-like Glu-specific endopeptidase
MYTETNTRVSDSPEPGNFYQVRKGDNLLKIAGKAYGVSKGKKRLAFAQFINRSALNEKYWTKGTTSFITTYFPSGIISFKPKFSSDIKELLESRTTAPPGRRYAVIWIPPVLPNNKLYMSEGDDPFSDMPRNVMPANTQNPLLTKESSFIKVKDRRHWKRPFRWICIISSYFPDPDSSGKFIVGSGTGMLISPRHILTAAHVVMTDYNGSGKRATPARNIASRIKVAFGFHGKGKKNRVFLAKYDSDISKRINILVPDEWKASENNRDYDFAVIDLGKDINNDIKGYWGGNQNYRIAAVNPVTKKSRDMVSVGYPGWKVRQHIYSQWKSLGKTNNDTTKKYQKTFRNLLVHDADVYKGMSGGPIWSQSKTRRSFVRNLIAINSYSNDETVEVDMEDYLKHPGSKPLKVTFTQETDVGVAMTRHVLDYLNSWGIQV